MFIFTGDLVPKQDWRSLVALCFIWMLAHYWSASNNMQFVRPDDFPEVWCLY